MQVSLSTALLAVGGTALATSLGGAWFGLIPVGSSTGALSGWSSMGFTSYVPDVSGNWSNMSTALKVWAMIVFNLTEDEAGVNTDPNFMWFTGAGHEDDKFQPADYGLLGPKAGYVFTGMLGVGLAMWYVGYNQQITIPRISGLF